MARPCDQAEYQYHQIKGVTPGDGPRAAVSGVFAWAAPSAAAQIAASASRRRRWSRRAGRSQTARLAALEAHQAEVASPAPASQPPRVNSSARWPPSRRRTGIGVIDLQGRCRPISSRRPDQGHARTRVQPAFPESGKLRARGHRSRRCRSARSSARIGALSTGRLTGRCRQSNAGVESIRRNWSPLLVGALAG